MKYLQSKVAFLARITNLTSLHMFLYQEYSCYYTTVSNQFPVLYEGWHINTCDYIKGIVETKYRVLDIHENYAQLFEKLYQFQTLL